LRREYHEAVVTPALFEGIEARCQLCNEPITDGYLVYAFPVGCVPYEGYHGQCWANAYYADRSNRFLENARTARALEDRESARRVLRARRGAA
jgi:hypothetical protein